MHRVNQALLMLHFVGLALGLAVSFANMVMGGLIAKAAPGEKAVLGRFPPAMSRVGRIGLGLLWVTGVSLLFTKWNGPASLPWPFAVKLSAVVLLTITVGYIYWLERRVAKGDSAAGPRIRLAGMIAMGLALVAILCAVLTFD